VRRNSLGPGRVSTAESAPALTVAVDRVAFGIRLEPLMEPLLKYFARRVLPRDDAYDCLSETLTVLWTKRRAAPADDTELRAWSFGIAKNVLRNHERAARRRTLLAEKTRESAENGTAVYDDGASRAVTALASLTPRDRELVTLIVWDGLGVAEAGAVLGLSAPTARTRYSRARAVLRRALDLPVSQEG